MLLRNEGLCTEGTRDFDGMWPKTEGASVLINIFPRSKSGLSHINNCSNISGH
jgi:hypothetical protein